MAEEDSVPIHRDFSASTGVETSNPHVGMSQDECVDESARASNVPNPNPFPNSLFLSLFCFVTSFVIDDGGGGGGNHVVIWWWSADPTVRFLREHMEKAGCPVWPRLLTAANCADQGSAGGYASRQGFTRLLKWSSMLASQELTLSHVLHQVTICCNHMTIQDEINQVVIHELIHAYDDCRAKNLDWKNCAHHACSEIRANHLSGDCHYKRELLRGFMKIRGHEQECVKRRALKSVRNNPYCSDAAAKDAIEAVWDICYNDTHPFDRAP
uniref:Mitochondrial inner membrane protease ATP23 n=1 Tax=Ananas comosus var. bracteatus TaxID=296719 RepID=A0A6V7Q2N0_ANACO|nr:unnamed protein product [Ananas comosus var. bracteatus]